MCSLTPRRRMSKPKTMASMRPFFCVRRFSAGGKFRKLRMLLRLDVETQMMSGLSGRHLSN